MTGEMRLFHSGASLGALERYSFETPWATAWLVADDPALARRYASVDAFRAWVEQLPDELPDAEADARYDAELAARGLDEAEVRAFWSGWEIQTSDGAVREVSVYRFESDGSVTWRWGSPAAQLPPPGVSGSE